MKVMPPRPRLTLPTLRLPRLPAKELRAQLAERGERIRRVATAAKLREEAVRDALDEITADLWVDATDPDSYALGYDGRECVCRTVVVRARPTRAISAGWIADVLFQLEGDVQVALHVDPIQTEAALSMLNAQRVVQFSIADDRTRGGQIADHQVGASFLSADELVRLVSDGHEALFAVTVAFTLRATRERIDALERRLRNLLRFQGLPVGSTRWQQRAGFLSAAVPYPQQLLGRRWTCDTTTLAFSLPWLDQDVGTSSGAYLGSSLSDRRPVRLDPWATEEGWPAGHGCIPAPNGGGKTVAAGQLIAQLYGEDDPPQIVVVDPIKGDFRRMVGALDGQIIHLSTRPDIRLNPFDLPPAVYLSGTGEEAKQNPVLEQTRLATGLLLMMARTTGDDDEAVIEDAVLAAYTARGITPDDERSWTADTAAVPTLAEVVARIAATPEGAGASLARKLQRFCTGTLAGLFAGHTTLDVTGRLLSFDLERMDARLRPIGVWLISNWVWQQAKRDRARRFLYLEEVKTLLEHAETARLVAHLYSLGRAYRLAVWSSTQLLSDYTETQEGRRALENAHTVLLLKQAQGGGAAVERYGLSGDDQTFLEGCTRGDGILVTPKNGRAYARIHVDPSPWVLELMGGPAAEATSSLS